jgi:hypothetical protein
VIEKHYRAIYSGGILSIHFLSLADCEKTRPGDFYLEITYTDGKPTGSRIIAKDQA